MIEITPEVIYFGLALVGLLILLSWVGVLPYKYKRGEE